MGSTDLIVDPTIIGALSARSSTHSRSWLADRSRGFRRHGGDENPIGPGSDAITVGSLLQMGAGLLIVTSEEATRHGYSSEASAGS